MQRKTIDEQIDKVVDQAILDRKISMVRGEKFREAMHRLPLWQVKEFATMIQASSIDGEF